MLSDYEQRMEESEEQNQTLSAEKQKLKGQLLQTEEQLVASTFYILLYFYVTKPYSIESVSCSNFFQFPSSDLFLSCVFDNVFRSASLHT